MTIPILPLACSPVKEPEASTSGQLTTDVNPHEAVRDGSTQAHSFQAAEAGNASRRYHNLADMQREQSAPLPHCWTLFCSYPLAVRYLLDARLPEGVNLAAFVL